MTDLDAASEGKTETRDAYARIVSLLELSVGERRLDAEWKNDLAIALRTFLADAGGPQAHLLPALIERLPVEVSVPELARAWRQLSPAVRDKMSRAFGQKAVFLATGVALAKEFQALSDVPEATSQLSTTLRLLRKPAGAAVRKWVDQGGLTDLLILFSDLGPSIPEPAGHLDVLTAVAEHVVKEKSTGATRRQVETFVDGLRTLIDTTAFDKNTSEAFIQRLDRMSQDLLDAAAKAGPRTAQQRRKTATVAEGVSVSAPDAGRREAAPSPQVPRPFEPAIDLNNPRLVIDAFLSVVKLLEELERRRLEQTSLERSEAEKFEIRRDLEQAQEDLGREQGRVAALMSRVGELETALETVRGERDTLVRRHTEVERALTTATSRIAELEREHGRLLDALPQQRLAEFRNALRSRIKPVLDEIAEYEGHGDLPHEADALLDRCRTLKEILLEEQIASA